MSRPKAIEYADAAPQVRAVFNDIKRTRKVDDVNNFWKYLANDPALLKRTWESVKEVMAEGALSPLVKELLYVAVSVSNGSPSAGWSSRPWWRLPPELRPAVLCWSPSGSTA